MKLNKITTLLAATAMAAAMAGCSDDDTLTPLDKPAAITEHSTFNTLAFEWDKVENALQYSYHFSKTATGDIITTGVAQRTNATFTDLEPSTDYTLTVLAYAGIGSGYTTSEPIVLTARTADLVAIDAPQPEMTREINTVFFQWKHVASSQGYAWQLLDADGNEVDAGETRALNVDFTGLADGSYVFSIVAEIDEPGFTNSAAATVDFEFVRIHEELWQTTGIYTSALTGEQWDVTLIAYDDNSYTLQSWYGIEGYDLVFTIDESNADNMFVLSSETYTYDAADGSYSVPTGLASPATVKVFPADNRCVFEGTDGVGSVQLDVSDGITNGKDELSWGGGELTLDDLLGEWVMNSSFNDSWGYITDVEEVFSDTRTITIEKIDENTISIPVPYYWDYSANIVIDFETMKYTIAPKKVVGTYIYTFASNDGAETPVTGTVSKSRIVIKNWNFWNDGYTYAADATIELTRP